MPSTDQFQRLEQLFHELESLADEQRSRRLHELSQSEPELYRALLRLLEDSTRVGHGEQLIDELIDVAGEVNREGPRDPEQIGPYRLRELIGEGGMGRVYLAEQSEPVRRRVALKLTRRGLDSNDAVARFRAERQALAVLEHPNIARVFDAGSTEGGRPWFAMEYIDGVPITRWAADKGLDLHQRIQLLLPVCEAVQHAHSKGLIHRDLKPSNILVIDDGGIGRPMVIDFGIARVVDLNLDERTRATRIGELVGTPEYMSPEQAALGEIDIDTRSDIYTLGLVLYELLVGELPLSGQQLRRLGFQAMCQAIREGDTPRPSRGPSGMADDATLTWRSRLKGDLDSVLLKALAKDRDHRYGTAAALADDLRRYLSNEPVLAQPPSLRYRAAKFIRRHRLPVTAAAMTSIALLVGAVMATHGMLQARAALAVAEANLAESELNRNITNAYADAMQRLFGASEDIEWMTTQLIAQAQERHMNAAENPGMSALVNFAIGRHFLSRNDYRSARAVFEPWLQEEYGDQQLRVFGWQLLGFAYRYTEDPELALAAFRRSAELDDPARSDRVGSASRLTQIALLSREPADIERARAQLERLIVSNDSPTLRISLLNSLQQLENGLGHWDASHAAMRRTVEIIDQNPGIELAGRDTNRLNLAMFELYNRQDFDAVQAQLDALRQGEHAIKGESRESARALEIEGILRRLQGQPEAGRAALEQALPLFERYAGTQTQMYLRAEFELIITLLDLGRLDEAKARLDAALQRREGAPHQYLTMAEAYVALKESGAEAAREVLEARDFDETWAERGDFSRFHITKLRQAGALASSPNLER